MQPLVKLAKQPLSLCFLAYTCTYLLRTNLSAALPPMMADLGISKLDSGLMGSAFFWMYALGQLINSALVERVNPKWFVVAGLFLSGVANLLCVFAQHATYLIVLWGLNGFALSFLWCSMVKILSSWYQGEAYNRASFIINLPTTLGYVLNWSVLGLILPFTDWRIAFILPVAAAAVFLVFWVAWLQLAPGVEQDRQDAVQRTSSIDESRKMVLTVAPRFAANSIRRELMSRFFLAAATMTVAHGVVKEALNLWLPTMLQELLGEGGIMTFFSLLVLLTGTIGIVITSRIIAQSGKNGDCLVLLQGTAFVAAFALYLGREQALIVTLCSGVLVAALSGMNVVLTTILPARYGRPAQVSGMLNFAAYLGAAVGGGLSGYISGEYGFAFVYLTWAVVCFISFGVSLNLRRGFNSAMPSRLPL